jgi:hypothetical protein
MHDQIGSWIDRAVWLCAGVAAVSLSQLAFAVTIVAGLASISLAALRWHDRLKYGPGDRK